MSALDLGYRKAVDLPHGAKIYLYGNRTVIDVHNTPDPAMVRLVTSDGTFEMLRDTWIAPAGDYPRRPLV